MRRVMRLTQWGKLTNKKVTDGWGHDDDMRAHGTQKLRQKPCAHTKQKHKHMASNKSPAMCKTRHEHAANEKTHKPPCSHKTSQHESTEPNEKHKLRAHKHNITWMHTADKTWTACKTQHTTTCGQFVERTRDHTLFECPNPDTKPKLKDMSAGIRTPHFNTKQGTRRERAHGSSTLEAAHSHEKRTWRECQGSFTKP